MRRQKTTFALLAALLAALLCPSVAAAERSEDVRARAASESDRLLELVDQMEQGRAEVDLLSKQIGDLADQSIALQGTLIEDRQSLASTVATTYRSGGLPSTLEVMLRSKSLEDFVANLYYTQKVTEWEAKRIEAIKTDKLALEQTMGQIEESRNERLEALDTLDATRATIEKNIDVLYARAATLEEEERKAEEARLAEIARQAKLEEQRRQEEEAKAQAAAEAARQAERLEAERQEAERQESEAQAARDAAAKEEAARQEAERQAAEAQAEAERQAAEAARAEEERRAAEEQAQAETTPDESVEVVPAQEPEPEPVDTSNAADWISCVASAYTIADNDPPGSTATASGIPLDDSVPTVAMPMSMNPARFYGSMIQIEYGGLTVVATVTDCGYLSGGARGLDITPAVFRAFGFSSADDWGLREVRYRFL
jgi:peptidoglycan hydrolase CwlO-like protein/3D (Asp-Asp-Asp) domain-containing protein